jgi:hypothetical protein
MTENPMHSPENGASKEQLDSICSEIDEEITDYTAVWQIEDGEPIIFAYPPAAASEEDINMAVETLTTATWNHTSLRYAMDLSDRPSYIAFRLN